jgi:hypothetical protein
VPLIASCTAFATSAAALERRLHATEVNVMILREDIGPSPLTVVPTSRYARTSSSRSAIALSARLAGQTVAPVLIPVQQVRPRVDRVRPIAAACCACLLAGGSGCGQPAPCQRRGVRGTRPPVQRRSTRTRRFWQRSRHGAPLPAERRLSPRMRQTQVAGDKGVYGKKILITDTATGVVREAATADRSQHEARIIAGAVATSEAGVLHRPRHPAPLSWHRCRPMAAIEICALNYQSVASILEHRLEAKTVPHTADAALILDVNIRRSRTTLLQHPTIDRLRELRLEAGLRRATRHR